MDRLPGTMLCTNPEIKAAFEKDALVVLTKNYTKTNYSYNPYLKENEVCSIIECGLCSYAYKEETKSFSKLVSAVE